MPSSCEIWIGEVNVSGVGFRLIGSGTLTYNGGGWSTVDRSRRQAYVEFSGVPLRQLELKLVLDRDGASVEPDLLKVARWQFPTRAMGEPPLLTVHGPVDTQGVNTWVCTDLTYEDPVIRDGPTLARTQQGVSMTLLEKQPVIVASASQLSGQLQSVVVTLAAGGVPVPAQVQVLIGQLPSLLQSTPPSALTSVSTQLGSLLATLPTDPARAAMVAQAALPAVLAAITQLAGTRRYVFRQGDSLARIAAREMGDYRRWSVIADLNGIRDPRAVAPGTRLMLP